MNKNSYKKVLVIGFNLWLLFVNSGYLALLEIFDNGVVKVKAETTTLTKALDWDGGEYEGTESDTDQGSVRLEADGGWDKREMTTPTWPINAGGTYLADSGYIYTFHGNGSTRFSRYQASDDRWKTLADLPRSSNGFSDMVKIGDYIYAEFGYYQEDFWRYHIPTNTWEQRASMPELANYGISLVTDGTSVYLVRAATREVYVYSIGDNAWTLHGLLYTTSSYTKSVYNDGNIYYHTTHNPGWWYKYNLEAKTNTRLADMPANRYYDSDFEVHDGYIYVLRSANTTDFWRYSIAENSWSAMRSTPWATYQGSGVVYEAVSGKLYVFRGNGSYDFWKYDITSNTFSGLTDVPIAVGAGSDLVRYQDKFYVPRGSGTTTFYEYNISSDTWTTKAVLPNGVSYRTMGVSAGSYLYFYRGNNTTEFYRYDPAGDSWTTMAVTPAAVGYGGVLAYPGSGDYIYGTRGSGTASFWRYSISGNSWDDAAASDLPGGLVIENGGAMTSDGTDLYLEPGIGISRLVKYVPLTDTWEELPNTPFAPYAGADIAYSSGQIYAIEGGWDNGFWVYDLTSSLWRKLPDFKGVAMYDRGVGDGASLEFDQDGELYMLWGSSSWFNKFSPTEYKYRTSGTWTSAVKDLSYVSEWSSLNVTSSTAGDSSVGILTRTSADLASWSDWQAVSGTTISSPVNRYIQVKASLTASTDRENTPVVTEISISYTGDVTAPTNPDSLTSSSQSVGGASLTSGTTYSYPHPYFSWAGASDGQTSVSGYYVYFGADEGADPESAGTWQTASNYIVTEPLGQTSYYLRIKTKDTAGNVRASWSAFTYVYSGIPSEYAMSVTTSDEFGGGELSSIQPWSDEIKLASASGGVWLEERVSLSPTYYGYGSKNWAYTASTNKFYAFNGNNNLLFYEYDAGSDVWTRLADAPANVYVGGGIIEGPEGYLYAMQGNNTNAFWIYSITENTWYDAEASDLPQTVYYGASMVYDGERFIYALRGNSDDAFWQYDTVNNLWTTLAPVDFGYPTSAINNAVYTGGSLAYDGDDTIYAIQGSGRHEIATYSIASGTWTPINDLPKTANLGASITYDTDTDELYYSGGNDTVEMYKLEVGSGTWSRIDDAPMTAYYGSSMRYVNGYIWYKRGVNSQYVFKYKTATNRWTLPTGGLFGANYAGTSYDTYSYGTIIKGEGTSYYIARGGGSEDFKVTRLANLPSGALYTTAMAYDGENGKVYYIAHHVQKLFVYTIASDSWSEDDVPPIMPNNYGNNLTYDGTRYLYWTRGQSTNFYRFDTQGETGSKWSQMANIPYIDYGGGLVLRDGYIYATRGGYTYSFFRYDIGANTWSDPLVADIPTGYRIAYGGALADGGDGYLYALRGENTSHFMRYSLASNTWSVITSMPGNATWGGALAGDGASRMFATAGAGTNNTRADGVYNYVMQTNSSGFVTSGTYTSQVFDLTKVYRFSNISLTYTMPGGTGITISTRTSTDGVTFGNWEEVSQGKTIGSTHEYQVNSTANRYIQIKIALSSDYGIASPVVTDYAVNYVQDMTEPSNPLDAGFVAYSTSTMSAQIASDTWNYHSQPHFVWPEAGSLNGASDGSAGSGVAG
ncbi:MAG: Microbial collagenase, partial [Microgenomates group bacterium GW2011_GWF2_47_9]